MEGAGRASSSKALLARVVTVYCVVALLASIAFGVIWNKERAALASAARERATALEMRAEEADKAEAEYRQLADDQAANRNTYTGQEAVAMSMKVQAAQTEVRRHTDERNVAQAAVDAAREKERVLSLRFVPLIAVGAVHFLLLILIALANPKPQPA